MLMRKTRRRFRAQPWDLFQPPPQLPTWEELPQSTKRQLSELLARLLREQHKQMAGHAGDKEVDHE
jgi:hypothetical protein